MRDNLPNKIRKLKECGIVNLDCEQGPGTHWVSYIKRNKEYILYFDSFGNLKPPKDIIDYFNSSDFTTTTTTTTIDYNYNNFQKSNDYYNCGHLCLEFLYKYS